MHVDLTSSKGHQKFLLALGLDLSTRVSAPPGGIYSSSCTNDIRIDSAHSGVSPTIWPACSNKEDRHSKIPPSSQELWIALLVAVTFREDTLMFAEALLKTILPNEDAHGFLIRIGDPSRRLREGETTMLFEKLQPLLYPGYEQLYK